MSAERLSSGSMIAMSLRGRLGWAHGRASAGSPNGDDESVAIAEHDASQLEHCAIDAAVNAIDQEKAHSVLLNENMQGGGIRVIEDGIVEASTIRVVPAQRHSEDV